MNGPHRLSLVGVLAAVVALAGCTGEQPAGDPTSGEFGSAKAYALRIAPAAPEPGVLDLDDKSSEDYCEDVARVLVRERNYDRGNSVGGCLAALDEYRADYAKNPGRYG